MNETTYSIWIDNTCYAKGMVLQTVTILAKALFDYYWEDPTIRVTIQRDEVSTYKEEENLSDYLCGDQNEVF